MKARNFILMCAVAIMTVLASSQMANAFFWTDNPGAWGHDDSNHPVNGQDGELAAEGRNLGGQYHVTLSTIVRGSTVENASSIIVKTDSEDGMACMWVTSYYLYVERYNLETTKCVVTLDLYHKEHGQGPWLWADTDAASVIINFYDNGNETESGHLYVWCDCDYCDTDQFKLVATAKCQWYTGWWVDIIPPVTSMPVYFEIDEV